MMKEVELGNVCHFENGDRGKNYPSQSAFVEIGIPFISAKDLENNLIKHDNLNYISEETYNKLGSGKLQPNDILFCLRGSLGKFAINKDGLKGGIASSLVLLRAKEDLQINYLKHYLNSPRMKRLITKSDNGSSQPNLSGANVKKFPIPLPPLEQQKKIAAILDAADAYRQKTKALITKYDELIQSLFLDMFGDPVRNPKGWEKVVFGSFITVLTDYHSNGSYETLSKHVTLKNEPDFSLMVRTTDLEKNNFIDGVKYIDEHAYNHLSKSKIYGGEIIMNKIGSAGKVYRMPQLNRPVSLGMNAFLLRFNDSINQVFLYFQLTSKYGEREIQKRVKGAVTKTIRKDAVREIPILSPPLKLQNQFADIVQAIESQKAQAQASLAQAEDLFNSLLQRAFKGELL